MNREMIYGLMGVGEEGLEQKVEKMKRDREILRKQEERESREEGLPSFLRGKYTYQGEIDSLSQEINRLQSMINSNREQNVRQREEVIKRREQTQVVKTGVNVKRDSQLLKEKCNELNDKLKTLNMKSSQVRKYDGEWLNRSTKQKEKEINTANSKTQI